MMKVKPSDLDRFVAETDEAGPLGSDAVSRYWAGFRYVSNVPIDQSIDPYSEDYVAQQIALYEEISGRRLDQTINEMTSFEFHDHVVAPNPYAHQSPTAIGLHMSRISRAIQHAGLNINDHVLDMGCGWGLSSELLAFSGLAVTALDINPQFVQLVAMRAAHSNKSIKAINGTFESIPGEDVFDAVLYYECLHHAVRPWEALKAARQRLKPGAKLILAGEPINDMWDSWGLRTDPLSIYCIRKFGWFESGWSLNFISDCIRTSGYSVDLTSDEGGSIGWIITAHKNDSTELNTSHN